MVMYPVALTVTRTEGEMTTTGWQVSSTSTFTIYGNIQSQGEQENPSPFGAREEGRARLFVAPGYPALRPADRVGQHAADKISWRGITWLVTQELPWEHAPIPHREYLLARLDEP